MSQQPVTASNVILEYLKKCRGSRKLVLLIVAIALLLDNMLLSSVVPIIPSFLFEIRHREEIEKGNLTNPFDPSNYKKFLTTTTPVPRETPRLMPLWPHPNSRQKTPCNSSTPWNGEGTPPYDENMPDVTSPGPYVSTMSKEMELRHFELVNENVEVGLLFASKPTVQAITNPFIGPLTNRIGYSIPMFSGFIIMFLSTLIFAVGKDYPTLFIARSLQGVGSACTSVAGMGMLADCYTDDKERGNAMALALGGLALGVLIGPPFGGIMYEFVGRASPFIVLAALALLDGLLQLVVLQPKIEKEGQEGPTLFMLLRDPYIVICAGAITAANLSIAVLEPSLPLWMIDTMNAPNWQQGAAFLPASISYLIGTNAFGPLGHKMGRWLASMVGLLIISASLFCVPLATNVNHLIIPNAGIGVAIGMVDSCMMPMLGHLADLRHTSVYGNVYAIGDVGLCVAFAIGPAISGALVKAIGFKGLTYTVAIICLLYAPLMLFLRKPPGKDENQALLMKESSVKYVTYTNDDSPDEEIMKKPQEELVK